MRVLFTSAALAGLVLASPSAAEPVEDSYAVSIAYGDLNMSSAAGVEAFNGRVKAQAKEVCRGPAVTPLQQTIQFHECRARFLRSAERQLQMAIAPSGGAILAAR